MMTGLAGWQRLCNHEWLFLVFAICMRVYDSLIMKMQRCDDDAWQFAMCDDAWLFCKPSCDDDWLCSCLQICMCAKSNFQNELRKTDLMIQK